MEKVSLVPVFLLILPLTGCLADRTPPPVQKAPSLSALPAELTVQQRSTTAVPGSDGALRLTIDDITRGQVMASLIDRQGGSVLATTSLKPGDSASFNLGDDTYRLTLKELNNALVGEDFAHFVISQRSGEALTEVEKIERLLEHVESAEDMVFIRSGVDYTGADAANHLRSKWQAAGARIETAEDFIKYIATGSSLTGEAYRVRKPDGTEMPAADYLRAQLEITGRTE